MTRKSHTKSRHGCINCKQRRVKCDEQKPECRKCITRGAVCSYSSLRPLVWVNGNTASVGSTGAKTKGTGAFLPAYASGSQESVPSTNYPSLNIENVDLVIHWFTTTVHTVNPISNSAALEICQTVILQQAMEHPFLLHGLLALSALHLADSHSDPQKYTRLATAHHTRGLTLYHAVLSHINDANYAASIAFSSLTIMFSFGLSRPLAGKAVGMELVDDLAQIFLLVKGWHEVVCVADNLECRAGSNIFRAHTPTETKLSIRAESAFGRLQAFNKGHHKEVYSLAISSLELVLRSLAEKGKDNPHVALDWANTVPEDFVRLIKERQELALVIVGYYCVVLHSVPQVWWLEGWSKGLFSIIWRNISCTCQDVLDWPREMIGFHTKENEILAS